LLGWVTSRDRCYYESGAALRPQLVGSRNRCLFQRCFHASLNSTFIHLIRMRSRKCRHKQDPLSLERLEPRLVLANVAITEFMADNGPTLDDGDGNSSDWFEVRNLEGSPTNLSGWHATDDPGNLTKWSFPNVMLAPFGAADNNDFLVLFASAQTVEDYVDAEENLHTNFALNANGDYIALVDPTNTIVSEYGAGGANFPERLFRSRPIGGRDAAGSRRRGG